MTGLLASVRNLAEARLALAGGADIIDLKEPWAGALGAVPTARILEIRSALGPGARLSATIGDHPMHPQNLAAAVATTAATGVDYVKVGFFPGGDRRGCIAALAETAAQGVSIVAVLFAELGIDLALLNRLQGAGVRGAMLDTASKGAGLCEHLKLPQLALFVQRCRKHDLLCGLAGSLRLADIPPLLTLEPDYLGFRGALCNGDRRGRLDRAALAAVRANIPLHSSQRASAS